MDDDDFDDDEEFGLGVPAVARADKTVDGVDNKDAVDDEEDIYGDIAGPSSTLPAAQTALEAVPLRATSGSLTEAEQQALTNERKNSGQLAECHAPGATNPSQAKSGAKAGLPKRLADTTVVYVGDLHWWTTYADIERICIEFGPLESITFFEDKGSGKSKGYVLVKFGNKEAANLCRQQMNGMEINGRKCVVTFSSNSHAATKAGSRQELRTQPANGGAPGRGPQGRGPHPGSQPSAMYGRGRGRGSSWGMPPAEPVMPVPPMLPWGPAMPMMGMGTPMGGLPMPGMGMPFPMQMMNGRGQGNDGNRDYKRQRF